MEKHILELKNVFVTAETKSGSSTIIQDICFTADKGDRLAIVGESGCGKTMTAMAIFGLLPGNCHAAGKIYLNGKNLLELKPKEMNAFRGKAFAFIPQNGSEFLNPVLKIKYQMFETFKANGINKKRDMLAKATDLLYQVGFENPETILNKYSFQLSGGMAQRVILAIGLSSSPQFVIADEPTRGVDEKNALLFLNRLDESFQNSAVILITHSIDIAERCNKIAVMYAGMIMEYGDAKEILQQPVHPYTQSLIHALPENGFEIYQNPDGIQSETGCPFYAQCPKAKTICAEQIPQLHQIGTVWRRCFFV